MSDHRSPRLAVLTLALCVGACSSAPADDSAAQALAPPAEASASETAPAADATVVAATEAPAVQPAPQAIELAPMPYTAEQIRLANPDGTEVVFAMRDAFGGGGTRVMRFANGDAESVTVESWYEDADGEKLPGSMSGRSSWQELRQHAAFPAAWTTRGEARREVGAGSFDCWIYEVRDPAQPAVLQRFAFAKERAGPPVLLEVFNDGELLSRMELVEVR